MGAIEVVYTFGGEPLKFGLEVDAMIDPAFRRDVLAMRRQHDVLFKELNRRGFGWVFTKPNNSSYLYLKTLLGFSDIGHLWAYAFPIRPFRALHPWLSFLDALWLIPVKLAAWIASPKSFREASLDELQPEIPDDEVACVHRARDAEFLRNRYGTGRYHAVARNDSFVVFSTTAYGRRSACFALEAKNMSFRDWLAFIRYTAARYPDVDVILRITGSQKLCLPLFRVPRRFLPNKFRIVGKAIGDRALPANVEFRMDLSDFEVV